MKQGNDDGTRDGTCDETRDTLRGRVLSLMS